MTKCHANHARLHFTLKLIAEQIMSKGKQSFIWKMKMEIPKTNKDYIISRRMPLSNFTINLQYLYFEIYLYSIVLQFEPFTVFYHIK